MWMHGRRQLQPILLRVPTSSPGHASTASQNALMAIKSSPRRRRIGRSTDSPRRGILPPDKQTYNGPHLPPNLHSYDCSGSYYSCLCYYHGQFLLRYGASRRDCFYRNALTWRGRRKQNTVKYSTWAKHRPDAKRGPASNIGPATAILAGRLPTALRPGRPCRAPRAVVPKSHMVRQTCVNWQPRPHARTRPSSACAPPAAHGHGQRQVSPVSLSFARAAQSSATDHGRYGTTHLWAGGWMEHGATPPGQSRILYSYEDTVAVVPVDGQSRRLEEKV